ncbi:hypothetical protein HanXRQr2_Chr17g0831661 [Helianthus annuus]|uniref:Uncharacterized protein n=1 Tax=Helianthus annuus TaxID=4232 RepID=A0A9K3DLM8_HELAN|nr:hypothetical protein HanXRQr2_Chr17g0831661 [Helianthus annuus]
MQIKDGDIYIYLINNETNNNSKKISYMCTESSVKIHVPCLSSKRICSFVMF